MGQFVKTMLDSFPAQITVPEPLVQYFEWIEANGLDRNFDSDGYKYAIIDPATEESCLGIVPVEPDHARLWLGPTDPETYNRLAPFCVSGGDGSRVALWVDDDGVVQIVHLGSGSGSVAIGIMVANPVDFLRLLAIGYDELCWTDIHHLTPEEAVLREHPDMDDYDEEELEDVRHPFAPLALRKWVSDTFGVSIPDRASDIVGPLPSMDAKQNDDPFWRWVRSLQK
jgi:hypothetical protein